MMAYKIPREPAPNQLIHLLGTDICAKFVAGISGGIVAKGTHKLESIPTGFILAPPHRSGLDITCSALAARNAGIQLRYVAKTGGWQQNRLSHYIMNSVGVLPVDREQQTFSPEVLAETSRFLGNRGALCIFPEGYILPSPLQRSSLKRGVGALAMSNGVPLIPMGIAGVEVSSFAPSRSRVKSRHLRQAQLLLPQGKTRFDRLGDGLAVTVGDPIDVPLDPSVDPLVPRSFVRKVRPVMDALFEGMQAAQAEAEALHTEHFGSQN